MDEKVMVVSELTGTGLCVVEKVIDNKRRYAVIEMGKSLSSIKKWRGSWLWSSMVCKGNYDDLYPPIPYEEWVKRNSPSNRG